jgi:hypothetical protein
MLEYRVSAAVKDVSKSYETAPDNHWGYVVFVYYVSYVGVVLLLALDGYGRQPRE